MEAYAGSKSSHMTRIYAYTPAHACAHTHTEIERETLPDGRTPPLYLYISILYLWVYFLHITPLKTGVTKVITSSSEKPHDAPRIRMND